MYNEIASGFLNITYIALDMVWLFQIDLTLEGQLRVSFPSAFNNSETEQNLSRTVSHFGTNSRLGPFTSVLSSCHLTEAAALHAF